MASRAEDSEPPGKVRYKRIEEKIQRLARHNIERETKEILEILDEGNIIYPEYKYPLLYPEREPSIMEQLIGKTNDLYLERSFAKLVQTLDRSYEASEMAEKEFLEFMVWSNTRTEWITSDSIARKVIAKLKIYTPLDQVLCAGFLDRYIRDCDIDEEWNSHFVGVLTFLIKEGPDPFHPVGYTRSAFSLFLEQFSPHLSDSLMPLVTTFLEEAFKKWEVSRKKESILYDIISNLPIKIIRGDSIHLSSVKELIFRNCLEIIKTNPHLCDYEDREGKTPLHTLMEIILKHDLWKEMPGLVAGTDTIWDLMSGLITNKNVNIKDKYEVTPYSWILWWQNSVTDLQTFDPDKNEELAKKIQDMKKHFLEKGASEEDALQGQKSIRSSAQQTLDMTSRAEASEPPGIARYKRIEAKIKRLTRNNIERETKEILEILDEGNIIYPDFSIQKPSIVKLLVCKTHNLYLEPSFAKLVQTLYPSYQESTLAKIEDLEYMVWSKTRTECITSDSIAREVIAKLKIYTPLDQELCTWILGWHIYLCNIDKEWNSHFVGVLTFLIKEGADPFDCPSDLLFTIQQSISDLSGSSAFGLFLEKFSPRLSDSLMPSVSTFLEEAFKKWEVSRKKESILHDIILDLPIKIIRGDSIHLSSVKELIVRNCLEIIKTNPHLCDYEDRQGKTPLHKLMEIILKDDSWKRIPGLATGTDKLWDLMSGLITNKNVNHKDIDKVTPYAWILWWQESVTDYQIFNTKEKQNLVRKIEDIKKQFEENGACEKDARQGLKNLRSKRQSGIFDGFKKLFRKNQDSKKDGRDRTKDPKNPSNTPDSKTIGTKSGQETKPDSEPASPTDEECDQHLPITVRPASPKLVRDVLNNPKVYYKMSAKPRGRVIILNNEKFEESENAEVKLEGRIGSYFDVENSRKLFEALHFEVVVWNNITATEIRKKIKQECESDFHEKADAFIFIILSHGKKRHIYGTDCRPVHINNEIVGAFSERCPQLTGKPKLFFIQACQGDQFNEGTLVPDSTALREKPASTVPIEDGYLPLKADVLTSYSTVPGYVSWRSTVFGSWFIRDVVICLNAYAHDDHVVDIMTKVNSLISDREVKFDGYKQMSEWRSTLRKKLYFLP